MTGSGFSGGISLLGIHCTGKQGCQQSRALWASSPCSNSPSSLMPAWTWHSKKEELLKDVKTSASVGCSECEVVVTLIPN